MAAFGIFVVGGLFAIADGVQTLRRPEPVTNVPVEVMHRTERDLDLEDARLDI